jgi:hypothetical protein
MLINLACPVASVVFGGGSASHNVMATAFKPPLHHVFHDIHRLLTVHFNLGVPAGYSAANFDTTEPSSILLIGQR